MNGRIVFKTLEELARFLKEFSGSSATFSVEQTMCGNWVLEFDGGS